MQKSKDNTVIYQAKNGAIALRGDLRRETVWATQLQIARAFLVDVRTINEHIQNIVKTRELDQKSTIRKFRIVQQEGKREIEREVKHYNLDMILSVGYRVNSKRATQFRQWATKTLKDHIVKGYTLDRKQVAKNYDAFLKSVSDIQQLLPEHKALDPKSVLDLVKEFSSTWLTLDAYDKGDVTPIGTTKKEIQFTGEELGQAIAQLRSELIRKNEATDLFAHERNPGNVGGIVGNVLQSFAGKDVYPTIEEKAAHLLYFMVKNHPFTDGNKRSGAFAFVWFLRKARLSAYRNMNPSALTALTLLIAESDARKKDLMTGLVTRVLK